MAGTRAYVRGSNGRFAGKGPGTQVTQGRAGGFANGAFRARVAQGRLAGVRSPSGKAPASRGSRVKRTISAAAHNRKVQAVALASAGGLAAHKISKQPGIVPTVKKLAAAATGGGTKKRS